MNATEVTPPQNPLGDLLRIAEAIERFDRDHPMFGVLARASEVCLEDYQCFVKQVHVVKMEMAEPGLPRLRGSS